MQRGGKRRKAIGEQRAAEVEYRGHQKDEREADGRGQLAPVRGYEQHDSGSEKDSSKNHSEKDRPAQIGVTLLPGFEGEDAISGFGIDQTGIDPAMDTGFELRALVHGCAKSE